MSSPEISEDEQGLSDAQLDADQYTTLSSQDIVNLCSDDDTDTYYTSDEEIDLPAVDLLTKKSAVIKNLFSGPSTSRKQEKPITKNVPSTSTLKHNLPAPVKIPVTTPDKPKDPGIEKMIGGVKINLPVKPYPCQIALMAKIITAINKCQNCLLESPTGSGKTLALLCGALAWQHQERTRMSQVAATHYVASHPEINKVDGAKEYLASPPRKHLQEISFANVTHGGLSIYDKPLQNGCVAGAGENTAFNAKRQEPDKCYGDSPTEGQVTIHKKRRLNGDESKTSSPELPSTPEKKLEVNQPETPEAVRLPTIYYGARTHKQLQQVIKEFARTFYCGEAGMTILSSREYSCIREFDKPLWGTKNDMCRGCTKKIKPVGDAPKRLDAFETNCKFYDNRQALSRENMPPAFDLEDLVEAGHELMACPYYGARAMAQDAQIVFCPYNYLIEPGIRNSMQIDLRDNIVIIDEAHNIEDICRDAATFTFTKDAVEASIKELDGLTAYRVRNDDVMDYVIILLRVLKNWGDWFSHQLPLINNKPVINNEAVHVWDMDPFVQTLNNHNIGQPHYNDFSGAAQIFTRRFREDPHALYGVTQPTGNLIEAMDTVFGYLFRDDCKYKSDFKPVLVRTVYGSSDTPDARGWRSSQFNKWIDKETLSLRLLCMSPAVVFSSVTQARCVLLASGTLTPLVSLHSELGTEFPLQISPNHVISPDRVWIGTLTTCPNGRPLECNSRATSQCDIQDALGETVLWVSQVTPHGVLCFLPNYALLNKLAARWQETGLWRKLVETKHVFMESRNVKDHNDIMEDYYKYVPTEKGALLFAVYRGKVSEGMDFKDQQARAVITVGIPYPNMHDLAVKQKMGYNDKYASQKKLLPSNEWLRVQAFRALNQAVGRCVRHAGDWGAVLLVDARFAQPYYTQHLSKWVKNFLGNNHHTFESLVNSTNSLESFMQNMTIRESEDI